MPTPLVSILIPAYGVAPYIAEALDSVFAQTFSGPFEVILVNDGSPDTVELEKAVAPYRDRIVYHVQANGGPSAARNTAFRMSSAPLIALLDGDDAYLPDYLQVQTEILAENPDLSLTYGDMETFDGRRLSEMIQQIEPPALESLLRRTATVINTPTIRREAIIDAGGWDESSRRCEDLDLWLRIAAEQGKLKRHSRVIGRYRIRGGSLSKDVVKMGEGQIYVFRKLLTNPALPKNLIPLVHERIAAALAEIALVRGKDALRNQDFVLAKRFFTEASKLNRSNKMSAVALLPPRLLYVLTRLRGWALSRYRDA
jgi:glycosyltransferase involved in cell wall biosynthesis